MSAHTLAKALPALAPQQQAIAIVDLGGQYCHMIGRRLRDFGVRSEVFPDSVSANHLAAYSGIILSGGPQSVNDAGSPMIDRQILALGVPVLGICYGHQLLAKLLGCEVISGDEKYSEWGMTNLHLCEGIDDSIFSGTPKDQIVWMSHGDSVVSIKKGMKALATTDACSIAAFADVEKKLYGVQFHPEVAHTVNGLEILTNFCLGICEITEKEDTTNRVSRLLDDIRAKAGNRSILFFVSGGVDSTVAFALCARALPKEQIRGIYVDTGLMRKNETAELRSILDRAGLADRLEVRNESERFLSALKDSWEPEDKRRIIGREFVEVQRAAIQEYGIDSEHWLLGQGTIYPDTVESGGHGNSTALIKTHHNRCQEIRDLIERGKVIEPLSEFYKDEVRQIGTELGLGSELTERWPFPGPGLAIRTLCVNNRKRSERQSATELPLPLVETCSLPARFSAYQGAFYPISTVGVQGDARTVREVLAVEGPLEYQTLADLSTVMCNSSKRFNRVIALVAGETSDIASASLKAGGMEVRRIDLLREADAIARDIMVDEDLTESVWQFPVVLVPISFAGGESIVLRPVNSEDGMTASFGKLPPAVLEKIGKEVCKLPGIDAVFLDVTNKPPATIEWE